MKAIAKTVQGTEALPERKNSRVSSKEESDLEYSRQVYLDLIEKNRESIEIMIELARDTDHPRVFEVLSNSIKTTSDITDRLISLHISNKQLKQTTEPKRAEQGSTTTTNNNVFIGSTEELQKLLQGKPIEKSVNP